MRSMIFLAIFLLFAANEAFAYKVTTFQPLQPVSQLPVPTTAQRLSQRNQYENYPKISQVESILFRRTYVPLLRFLCGRQALAASRI